jgi:hypothetical protein
VTKIVALVETSMRLPSDMSEIVQHGLSVWKEKLYCDEHTKLALDEASEMLSYFLRNVSGPENVAFVPACGDKRCFCVGPCRPISTWDWRLLSY